MVVGEVVPLLDAVVMDDKMARIGLSTRLRFREPDVDGSCCIVSESL